MITLEEPTRNMEKEAKAVGQYRHETMGRSYDRIQIVTVAEILNGQRLEIPMSLEVLKEAQRAVEDKQLVLGMEIAEVSSSPTPVPARVPQPVPAANKRTGKRKFTKEQIAAFPEVPTYKKKKD